MLNERKLVRWKKRGGFLTRVDGWFFAVRVVGLCEARLVASTDVVKSVVLEVDPDEPSAPLAVESADWIVSSPFRSADQE